MADLVQPDRKEDKDHIIEIVVRLILALIAYKR
jgi:hypothetical protein